jgi:murein DD-endopeptidase MepM/ murein hydrolase activator NlpD
VPAVAGSDEVIGGQNPQVASTQQLPAPEPMSGNSFRWPVQGRIISEFGTKPDGGHNDGINVAVPLGTSVKAAENGVVAYAGDELKGYGNLVLIRHSNNWVSAYAHNDEILVKRGDQVRRGQVIAKAGRTGQVNQPQLHFELRKGSRPVDPTKYMTNSTANAD